MTDIKISRRAYLRGLGWGAIGITAFTTGCSQINPLPPLPHRNNPTAEEASLWLSLRPDGSVEIASPRSEMGQGIATAIKQIVAEEMGVTIEQVRYLHPSSDRMGAIKATVGSESMMVFGPIIASAAAALSGELDARVLTQYRLKPDQYRITKAGLIAKTGEVFELAPLLTPAIVLNPDRVSAVQPKSFKPGRVKNIVGKAVPSHEVRQIVTGSGPLYADDIRLPDMLYARLITPPFLKAKIMKLSDAHLKPIPGYWGLVQEEGLLAILGESRGVLDRAIEKLVVDWQPLKATQGALKNRLRLDPSSKPGSLEHTVLDGDLGEDKPFDIDLTLTIPMAAHAAMEPRTAVARYTKGDNSALEVWTGTQDVSLTQRNLSKEFGLPAEKTHVQGMRIGGGFGGKVFSSLERDAVRLSQITGRPVKLQWTREDEFMHGYHRPPSEHRIRARLDENGKIEDWWHAFKSGHVIFSSAFLPPWMQNVTAFVADKGAKRGAVPPYEIPVKKVEFEDVRLSVDTGPWRGLGATPNCWAIETAIDVLAGKANLDPYEFRLRHLRNNQPRLAAVLTKVAEMSDWASRRKTANTAYGIACGIYKDMAYSATVAEITRDTTGKMRLTDLWSAHDCGFVVNPDQVRAQIEGNLVWGMGMVFYERLNIENNGLSATNFDAYNWATYSEVPTMEIALIGQDNPPTGAGETAIVSAAASITNAVFRLTGEPVVALPITH